MLQRLQLYLMLLTAVKFLAAYVLVAARNIYKIKSIACSHKRCLVNYLIIL